MRSVAFLVAAVVGVLCVARTYDDGLIVQCIEWMNQEDFSVLNQVAGQSHVSSCAQYCMIAGNGFRSDTTVCKLLCDTAGGFEKFAAVFTTKNETPEDMCKRIVKARPVDTVSLLEVGQTGAERKVGIRGDLTIQGTLDTSVLTSPIGDVKVSGELHVKNSIEASSASGAFLKAGSTVSVKQGIVSKKDQLLVKGKIDADSVTSGGEVHYSFLEIDGVRQWSLHSLEDFDEVGVDGWSHGEVTECAGRKILGGHCVEKATPELTKTWESLPPHSQVRVVAKYLFIDSWDGESGYLKVDGNTMWVDSYNHATGDSAHGINLCGNETPERKLFVPIDVTLSHSGPSLTLSFGATTDEHSCDESFGIDSVMVFTR